MTITQFTYRVAKLEGKKSSVNIAQIKEIIRIIFTEFSLLELLEVWFNYRKVVK